MKKLNLIILLIFICCISLPAVFGLILPKRTNSFIENRRLAEQPKMPTSWQEIKALPLLFDKYYTDHFGFRWSLLYVYRHMKFIINDSPIDSSIFGKEKGWIYYASKIHGDVIGDYRNINRFTESQLETLIKQLQEKQQWLAQQNIKYIFVIAPSKHYIYPENLPDYIQPIEQTNLVKQLNDALLDHPEINFVNLAPSLIKAKDKQLLYFKADTHWNFFAANIAQHQIAQKLTGMFNQDIAPYLYGKNEFTQKQEIQGDLAQYMGLGKYFTEDKITPKFNPCTEFLPEDRTLFSTVCSGSELNALVFRDSFFSYLQPFISQYFNNSTFVWEKMTFKRAQERILINKPHVVIEEWVDRFLPRNLSPQYEY